MLELFIKQFISLWYTTYNINIIIQKDDKTLYAQDEYEVSEIITQQVLENNPYVKKMFTLEINKDWNISCSLYAFLDKTYSLSFSNHQTETWTTMTTGRFSVLGKIDDVKCFQQKEFDDFMNVLYDFCIVFNTLLILNEEIGSKKVMLDDIYTEYENRLKDLTNKSKSIEENAEILRNQNLNLSRQLYRDNLTGLHSRISFMKELYNRITKIKRLAIIYIDIDNFKYINDTLGHAYGDKLLIKISDILAHYNSDNITTARYGGDEFIVGYYNFTDKAEVESFCVSLLDIFNKGIPIQDNIIELKASLGVSIYPEDTTDVDQLLKFSDMAMYKAKEQNNTYVFYARELAEQFVERVVLERELSNAIQENEITLAYQPKVNSCTKTLHGFEVLARWCNKGTWIPPFKFIALAEEANLINELGMCILENACKQLKEWNILREDLKLGVNISAIQLQRENFAYEVLGLINKYNINPRNLDFEITESVLMENMQICEANLAIFVKNGITISLDDFGTGYSSFNYMKKLPITYLKLDKSFIDDIVLDKNNIVNDLINMCHKLNLIVVAEGVEDIEQYELLKTYKCDIIQGYYFSKPVFVEDAEKIIAKGHFN